MKIKLGQWEMVDVSKLVPHPRNPNRHSIEQIKRLAKIIEFNGQRRPVYVSKLSGFITKGHCTLEAMKYLDWEKCAVEYQEYENEAEEYADIMADNEIARWAELDVHKAVTDIQEMNLDLDIDLLGLQNNDILADKLLGEGSGSEPVEGDEEFSKEIDEKNDYIVLLFDSKEDLKEAHEKLGIERIKLNLSVNNNPNLEITGTGRVIDGKQIIDRL